MSVAAERYLALIEATLRAALMHPRSSAETSGEFSVDEVLPVVASVLGFREQPPEGHARVRERLAASHRVVDRAGHSRPVYASLVTRWVRREAADDASLSRFRAEHLAEVESLAEGRMPIAAAVGSAVVSATFAAWAASFPAADDSAMSVAALRRVASAQQADGTFLARTEADAPEPRWYDELALLHALHAHATATRDEIVAAAVRRAVAYHAAETQPDHASSHPWAIAAFLATPAAIPLADMMLHAAGVQSPATMDAVSLLLLADALDCASDDCGQPRLTR